MTPAEANAKAINFMLDALFNPKPKPMSQPEMAQLWLEDLARRAASQEDKWYQRYRASHDLAFAIEEARYAREAAQ